MLATVIKAKLIICLIVVRVQNNYEYLVVHVNGEAGIEVTFSQIWKELSKQEHLLYQKT